jgi:hypothetical protein
MPKMGEYIVSWLLLLAALVALTTCLWRLCFPTSNLKLPAQRVFFLAGFISSLALVAASAYWIHLGMQQLGVTDMSHLHLLTSSIRINYRKDSAGFIISGLWTALGIVVMVVSSKGTDRIKANLNSTRDAPEMVEIYNSLSRKGHALNAAFLVSLFVIYLNGSKWLANLLDYPTKK